MLPPFHFQKWIAKHKPDLKPPVGNKQIFLDSTFIVMIVAGPNSRTDFHVNQSDEFFYQLEGDIFLRILNREGNIQEIPIKEGEIFMLPRNTPHSPQRAVNTLGMVIEKTRTPGEIDGLMWFCQNCHSKLYEEFFALTNIETQFHAVFERYYSSKHVNCQKCGTVNGKTWINS